MPSRFFNSRAPAGGEDPYTRDTTPRTRTRSVTDPSARPAPTKRVSMTPTLLKPSKAGWARLPVLFNVARFAIFGAVLLFTVICLAIAVHFSQLLQSSDLTSFVPFGIFVSIASLLILVTLLVFTLWKRDMNPVSTRIEFGCLGLAATLWTALGAFMANSDAEVADVECYASESDTSETVSLPGFSTETFHAQYRVLEAFALFSCILLWALLLFMCALALRQARRGNPNIWFEPVTAIPWQVNGEKPLPAPVTSRGKASRSVSRQPTGKSERSDKSYFDDKAGAGLARGRSYRSVDTPATTPGSTPRGDGRILWMPTLARDKPQQQVVAPPPPPSKDRRPGARPAPSAYASRSMQQVPRASAERERQPARSGSLNRETSLNRDRSVKRGDSLNRDRSVKRGDSLNRDRSVKRGDSLNGERSTGRGRTTETAAPTTSRTMQLATRTAGAAPTRPERAQAAPIYDKFRRDVSPRRENSQRSHRTNSQRDKWGRDASPRR